MTDGRLRTPDPDDVGAIGSELGWVGDLEEMFPADPRLRQIHERAYVVRAYVDEDSNLVLRGVLRDQKPPGLYVADDPDPLTIHQMVVELSVSIPSLEITRADLVFDSLSLIHI